MDHATNLETEEGMDKLDIATAVTREDEKSLIRRIDIKYVSPLHVNVAHRIQPAPIDVSHILHSIYR
jgi:hypothetical protein